MSYVPMIIRRIGLGAGLGALALLLALPAIPQPVPSAEPAPVAVVATWKGAIGPASVRFLNEILTSAEKRSARAVVLRLDTPGGLVSSMREMVAAILASPVPVVGYVAPPGARAASAGTYILYACHIAAMAPGTNIGAATPIQLGAPPGLPTPGKPESEQPAPKPPGDAVSATEATPPAPKDAESAKAMNDALAFIRSLAELRGRNVDWALAAVRGASSLSARQALDKKVIDAVADDVPVLLKAIDGRTVEVRGKPVTLNTGGLTLAAAEPDTLTQILAVITNPNVAMLLMLVGFGGLMIEFLSPGLIAPGFIGAMCLVAGLYALDQLPLSYAGAALLLLGLAFVAAEAVVPTYGILATAGVVAVVFGTTKLLDTNSPEFALSWWTIGTMAIAGVALLYVLATVVWRSQRRTATTGVDELVGAKARVIDWSAGSGHVLVRGEHWQATGPATLQTGQEVRVAGIDGLTLSVRET